MLMKHIFFAIRSSKMSAVGILKRMYFRMYLMGRSDLGLYEKNSILDSLRFLMMMWKSK